MSRQIDPAIEQRPDLAKQVDWASNVLTQAMGATLFPVDIDWTLVRDHKDQELLDVRLSDWTGCVGYRFTTDELSDDLHMRYRINRLWGDLLTVRSHVMRDGRLGVYQEQVG